MAIVFEYEGRLCSFSAHCRRFDTYTQQVNYIMKGTNLTHAEALDVVRYKKSQPKTNIFATAIPGVSERLVRTRISRGWSFDKAMNTPPIRSRKVDHDSVA